MEIYLWQALSGWDRLWEFVKLTFVARYRWDFTKWKPADQSPLHTEFIRKNTLPFFKTYCVEKWRRGKSCTPSESITKQVWC